jgi:chromosome segregation ATPase
MALDKASLFIRTVLRSKEDCIQELISALNNYDSNEEDLARRIEVWIDDMNDKSERVNELESSLYYLEQQIDDIDSTLDDMRGYTNV